MGALAASGHLLVIMAYQHATASLLAPYTYSEIITATLISYRRDRTSGLTRQDGCGIDLIEDAVLTLGCEVLRP